MTGFMIRVGWIIGIFLAAYTLYSFFKGFVAVARPYVPQRRIWVEAIPPAALVALLILATVAGAIIFFTTKHPLAFLLAFDLLGISAALLLRGTARRGGGKLSL